MSKKSFIDSVEVKKPCNADWEKMSGNDKVRFCDHCAKSVNNISMLRRKDALRLVRASNGELCIRYIPNPVSRRPMFAEQLVQIARRTPALAAGFMTASISLSTLAYGQSPAPEENVPSVVVEKQADIPDEERPDTSDTRGGVIIGTIRDHQGRPLPGIVIYLANESSYFGSETVTDENGKYKFDDLEPETYMLRVQAVDGHARKVAPGVTLTGTETIIQDLNVRTLVRHIDDDTGVGSGVGSGSGFGGAYAAVAYSLPLNDAVSAGDLDKVRSLLQQGEKANGKDANYDDITPLFLAVEGGNVAITRLLIQYGAKVNARDKQKRTPLMFVDEDASPALIAALIEAGAKVNVHDDSGKTPLIAAAESSSVEVVNALIDAGAALDEADDEGLTPLMKAVERENTEAVDALIVAGADVTLTDKNGDTAWDKTSDPVIEKALVAAGASVNYDVEVEVVVRDEEKTPAAGQRPQDDMPNSF